MKWDAFIFASTVPMELYNEISNAYKEYILTFELNFIKFYFYLCLALKTKMYIIIYVLLNKAVNIWGLQIKILITTELN